MFPRKYSTKVFVKSIMVRTEEFKYIYCLYCPQDIDEFYDLKNDLKETINIIYDPEFKITVKEIRDRLLRWILETDDTVPF
jgi:hypothetical protein